MGTQYPPGSGAQGPAGPAGTNGTNGTNGSNGTNAPTYNSAGIINGAKVWIGQATVSGGAGAFSANISSAGFTAPPNVQITAASIPAGLLSNGGVASVQSKTVTATNVSGTIQTLQTLLGLAAIGLTNSNGVVLDIQAIGA